MAQITSIDLNTASAEDIMKEEIPGVTMQAAEVLVAYRDENGPFESWAELKLVPDLHENVIDSLRESGASLGEWDKNNGATEAEPTEEIEPE